MLFILLLYNLRDWSGGGRCVRCPCQGNEEGCRLLPSRQVECTCKAGFSGQACEYRGDFIYSLTACDILACFIYIYVAYEDVHEVHLRCI